MVLAALGRFLSPLIGTAPPADLVWITPDLAQSGQFHSRDAAAVRRLAIGAVLDLQPNARPRLAPLSKARLHYLHLSLSGQETPRAEDVARAADWVLQELGDDRKVLVHCDVQLSSNLIVLIALLLRNGQPLDEAIALVRRHHQESALSATQEATLKRYADSLAP